LEELYRKDWGTRGGKFRINILEQHDKNGQHFLTVPTIIIKNWFY
jgi:hypothetical protein